MKIDGREVIILHDEEALEILGKKDYTIDGNNIIVSGDLYNDMLTKEELRPEYWKAAVTTTLGIVTIVLAGPTANLVTKGINAIGLATNFWGYQNLEKHFGAVEVLKRDIIYDQYTGYKTHISELDSEAYPGDVIPDELNKQIKDFSLKSDSYIKLAAMFSQSPGDFQDYIDMQLGVKNFTPAEKEELQFQFDEFLTQADQEAIRLLKPTEHYGNALIELGDYYEEEANKINSIFEPSKEYLKVVEENKEEQGKQQKHENDIVAKQTEMANAYFEQQKREQAKQAIDNAKVSMQTEMANAYFNSIAKASQAKQTQSSPVTASFRAAETISMQNLKASQAKIAQAKAAATAARQSIVVSSKKQSVSAVKSIKPVKTVTSLFNSLSSKLARGI